MTEVSLQEYDSEADNDYTDDRFVVDDDRKAAWAVRKLAMYQSRVADARAVATAERERIDRWLVVQEERHASDIAYFTGLLTQYALAQRDQGRKSIDTPYGVVKTRAGQPKFVVDDHHAFLEYAKQSHPEWVRVREDADVAALKKAVTVDDTPTLGLVAVTEDGEIVPGLQITPAQVSVTVEEAK